MLSSDQSATVAPERVSLEHPDFPSLYNLTKEVHLRAPELVNLPLVRPIKLRAEKVLELVNHSHKSENFRAAMLYQRGHVQQVPCISCLPNRNRGPFITCVALKESFQGACANCAYAGSSSKCSFRVDIAERGSVKRSRSTKPLEVNDDSEYSEDHPPRKITKMNSSFKESPLGSFPAQNVEAARAWLRSPQNLVLGLYDGLRVDRPDGWPLFEKLLASITGADTPEELRVSVIDRAIGVSRSRVQSITESRDTPFWLAVSSKIFSFMETDKMARLWKDASKDWIMLHGPKYLDRCLFLSRARSEDSNSAQSQLMPSPPLSSTTSATSRGPRSSIVHETHAENHANHSQFPKRNLPATPTPQPNPRTPQPRTGIIAHPIRPAPSDIHKSNGHSHSHTAACSSHPQPSPPKPSKSQSARYKRTYDEAIKMTSEERQLELADFKFRVLVLKTAIANGPPTSRTPRYTKALAEVQDMSPEEQTLELADLEFRASVFRDAMGSK